MSITETEMLSVGDESLHSYPIVVQAGQPFDRELRRAAGGDVAMMDIVAAHRTPAALESGIYARRAAPADARQTSGSG
jgi:hypothetical protein